MRLAALQRQRQDASRVLKHLNASKETQGEKPLEQLVGELSESCDLVS